MMNKKEYWKNKKGFNGLVLIVPIFLFIVSFMFSEPIVTGLITGNDSLNINDTLNLENFSREFVKGYYPRLYNLTASTTPA